MKKKLLALATIVALPLTLTAGAAQAATYEGLTNYGYNVYGSGSYEVARTWDFYLPAGAAYVRIDSQYTPVEGYKSKVQYKLHKKGSSTSSYVAYVRQEGRVDSSVSLYLANIPAGDYYLTIDNDTLDNPVITGVVDVYSVY